MINALFPSLQGIPSSILAEGRSIDVKRKGGELPHHRIGSFLALLDLARLYVCKISTSVQTILNIWHTKLIQLDPSNHVTVILIKDDTIRFGGGRVKSPDIVECLQCQHVSNT